MTRIGKALRLLMATTVLVGFGASAADNVAETPTDFASPMSPDAAPAPALTPHSAEYKVKISILSGKLNTRLQATEDGYEATHRVTPAGLGWSTLATTAPATIEMKGATTTSSRQGNWAKLDSGR